MNVLDLFSGIGGFSLGLERAGMKTVAFCESNPACRKVLARHWPEVPIHDDIRKLDGTQFRDVDIVCGGFPCQDVSDAARGRNLGLDGDRSGLWYQMARVLEECEAPICLVENVDGAAFRRWVPAVRSTLYRLGYSSLSVRVRAVDVGAPHEGSRVFVAATNRNGESARAFHAQMALVCKPARRSWHWRRARGFDLGLDDGVPGGLAMYGNAVVPQVVEQIGRAIMAVA